MGWIVYGHEAVQQVAYLLRIVDEGGTFEPEGDVCVLERDLKCIEAGATRHQNADVLVVCAAFRSVAVLRTDLPAVVDRRADGAGDGFGFLAAHDAHIPFDFSTDETDGGRLASLRPRDERCIIGLRFALHPQVEEVVDPVDDRRLGAEVLLEQDAGSADRLPHLCHLLNVGAAEAVDRLLGVADDEELAFDGLDFAPVAGTVAGVCATVFFFGQKQGDLRLQGVGVLHFVDEDVGETVAEVIAGKDTVAEQIACEDEHVEELDVTGGLPFAGVFQRKALQQFEHRSQLRRLLAFVEL